MTRTGWVRRGTAVLVAMILACSLVGAAPRGGQAAGAEPARGPGPADSPLAVPLHQSITLEAPWPVKRVSVADPQIADVQAITPRQVLIQGKAVGSTTLTLWSDTEQSAQHRVDVEVDLGRLASDLKKAFPQSNLQVAASGGLVVVAGTLTKAEDVVELGRYLDGRGIKYVNMTMLAGVQQVLLQVRVAEVSRQAIRELGINAVYAGSSFFGGSVVGSSGGGPLNPVSIGVPGQTLVGSHLPFQFTSDTVVSPSVTLFGGFPKANLEIFLQALAENQYLRILAEPNLVALSGEEANFLAGGEYPIPVVQGSSVGGGSSISVEYKEFGVRLRFRPTVMGDNAIRLHVAPEVSQLSEVGAVNIQGFQIPSLVTRKAETTLELKSGQTFAMAGLISHNVDARNSRVPGLGDMPVLGPLFRSVRYTEGETELVVLVTASLVEPQDLASRPPVPGSLHVRPSDWELYCRGQLAGKAPPVLSEADAAWLKKLGLDTLKGPGPWETYEHGGARSRATVRPGPPAAAEVKTAPVPPPAPRRRPRASERDAMGSEGSVILVTKDTAAAEAVSAAMAAPGHFALVRTYPDLAAFATGHTPPGPAAVLVDIDPNPLGVLRMLEPVAARFPESRFVALTSGLQQELVLEAMQAGARHLLQKKSLAAELLAVLHRLAPGVTTRPPGQGAVLTVISGSGGAGGTLVALNLANEIGLMLARPTLLVDMDMSYGSLAPYLGLKGLYGLGHVLGRQGPVDDRLIHSSAVAYSDTVHVLMSPAVRANGTPAADLLKADRLATVLEACKRAYACTVIDAPRLPIGASTILAAASRAVLIIFQLTVKDIHLVRSVYGALIEHGVPADRVVLVANRFQKRNPVGLADAEKALGGLRLRTLSNDFRSAVQGINYGQPLTVAAPSSALRRDVLGLAENLMPEDIRAALQETP